MSHLRDIEHLKITLEAIKSATNNFADENRIGRGGFGKVYKGEIVHSEGQSMAAMKRLDRKFGQGNSEFWREITMLYRCKHENLIQLLGFCDESDEKILVYEFVSNMGLDSHLNSIDLTWTRRLRICIGMARGLAYLHNSVESQLRVLHRDVKSSNILLDEKWNAKISDFGLSKYAPVNNFTFSYTSVVGTPGYCDPLYMEKGFLTKESDVYSLGVVLFEVLCGRLCFSDTDDCPLIELARHCYELNKIDTIIFGNIRDEIDPDSLKAFTTIAYRCLKRDREERPLIADVVRILETALGYQPSEVVASPSASATANPSMPHATVAVGPHGLVQSPVAAGFLKHLQTPPGARGLEYQVADSDHLIKRARLDPSDERPSSGSNYPPNVYPPNDLPKTVVQLLNPGSNVISMDFHPQQQALLLVGSNIGEISIWEVGSRNELAHEPFKVWDIASCSIQFKTTFVKNEEVSVNQCTWGPDGSMLAVAFSKHIVHIYTYNQSGKLRPTLEIDAHGGGVNDIAFAHPNEQLCIVTCGDDKTIKVWDTVAGCMQYTFEGHEAPVYSVCPHYKGRIPFVFSTAIDGTIKAWLYDRSGSRVNYDAPGLWCTTMAYSRDGTRLFSCGTSKIGKTHLVEWNESKGAIKREYSGFRKLSIGVVQFDTTRNRFLAAGDEFQIKFWDMDNINMLTATDADGELPESPRLRFNKEGSLLAVTTSNKGIKILANGEGQSMIQRLENRANNGD